MELLLTIDIIATAPTIPTTRNVGIIDPAHEPPGKFANDCLEISIKLSNINKKCYCIPKEKPLNGIPILRPFLGATLVETPQMLLSIEICAVIKMLMPLKLIKVLTKKIRRRRGRGRREEETSIPEIIYNEVFGHAGENKVPGPVDSHSILVYITRA